MNKLDLLKRQIAKLKAEANQKREIAVATQELKELKRERRYGGILSPLKAIGRGLVVMGKGIKKNVRLNPKAFR